MAKSDKTERRAAVDHLRQQQKRADQRQGILIVGACVLIATVLLGIVLTPIIKEKLDMREFKDKNLNEVGAPAKVCGDYTTKPATGSLQHVPAGTPVIYPDSPPAFGEHEEYPDGIERKLYEEDDRPNVEKLVHNLEHGYTILWYDQTIADDDEQFLQLRAIADKLQGGEKNYRLKFKAVPWTKDDGKPFPKGQHVAFTHWAKESKEKDDKNKEQVGVWQYCSAVSGEGLEDFMLRYDYTNSPEPNVQ